MKQYYDNKGYESTYNIGILNFFNLKVLLKDTKSAIRNKLEDLLTELKMFRVVEKKFQKIQSDHEITYSTFYSSSKAKKKF